MACLASVSIHEIVGDQKKAVALVSTDKSYCCNKRAFTVISYLSVSTVSSVMSSVCVQHGVIVWTVAEYRDKQSIGWPYRSIGYQRRDAMSEVGEHISTCHKASRSIYRVFFLGFNSGFVPYL